MIHSGEQACDATRSQPHCRAHPTRGQVDPIAANQMYPGWENTVQGWQGYAVTRVCTDGRNKMFPSLCFPDRHVAKVRRGTTFFFFLLDMWEYSEGWFSSP